MIADIDFADSYISTEDPQILEKILRSLLENLEQENISFSIDLDNFEFFDELSRSYEKEEFYTKKSLLMDYIRSVLFCETLDGQEISFLKNTNLFVVKSEDSKLFFDFKNMDPSFFQEE